MSYDLIETGLESGAPVELYEFQLGATFYRYTSSDTDATYLGETYVAEPITRTNFQASAETAKTALKISCYSGIPVALLFKYMPPSEVVTLTVFRYHRNEPASTVVVWKGRVLNMSLNGNKSELHCESVFTSIKRPGLRRLYQKACPHVLFSKQCKVIKSNYAVARNVSYITSLNVSVINISAYADDYFAGGYFEREVTAGNFERRAIVRSYGSQLLIAYAVENDYPYNTPITIYPGCDHTLKACDEKYANVHNYGGMPFIPPKNPFDGASVF